MVIDKKLFAIVTGLLGVLIFYSVIMGLTTYGFVVDGYMTWKEGNRIIAVTEFSLSTFAFVLSVYALRKLLKH